MFCGLCFKKSKICVPLSSKYKGTLKKTKRAQLPQNICKSCERGLSQKSNNERKTNNEIKNQNIKLADYGLKECTVKIKKMQQSSNCNFVMDIKENTIKIENIEAMEYECPEIENYSYVESTQDIKSTKFENFESVKTEFMDANATQSVVKQENAQLYSNIEVKEEYKLTSYTFTNQPVKVIDNEPMDDMSSANETIHHTATTSNSFLNKSWATPSNLTPVTALNFGNATKTNPSYLIIFSLKSAYINSGLSYMCKLCTRSKKFHSASVTRSHIILKHFYKKFICSQCPEKFLSRALFQNHFSQNHIKAEFPHKVKFVLIKKLNVQNRLLKSYYRKSLKPICYFYICRLCNKSKKYNSLYRLRMHIKLDHYGKKDVNPQCDKEYTKNWKLIPNQKTDNSKETIKKVDNFYICKLCTKLQKYRTYSGLRNHIEVQHYGYRYVCPVCNKQYRGESSIRIHYKKIHKNMAYPSKFERQKITEKSIQNSRPNILNKFESADYIKQVNGDFYMCTLCSESSKFKTLYGLQRHIKLRHLNYRYVCTDCNEQFVHSETLRSHYLKEHQKVYTLLFRMQQVSSDIIKEHSKKLRFKSKYKLIDNKFCCTECSATYKSYQSIIMHIKNKHYGYGYICNECGCKYVKWFGIAEHYKKIHKMTVPRPMQMTKLDLVSNSTKEENQIKHNNYAKHPRKCKRQKKPRKKFESADYIKQVNGGFYICTLCSESVQFKSSSCVQRHVKVYHLNGQFVCPDCNEPFFNWATFRSHRKSIHGKKCPLQFRVQNVSSNNIKEQPKQLNYKSKYNLLDNMFYCTECCAMYKNLRDIQFHIKMYHFGYRYICTECGEKYISWLSITQHYKEVHKMSAPKPLQMAQVDDDVPKSTKKRFITRNNYKKVGNSFFCSLCTESEPTKYKTASTISHHVKYHHYGYRYICTECNEQFGYQYGAKKHCKSEHGKDYAYVFDAPQTDSIDKNNAI